MSNRDIVWDILAKWYEETQQGSDEICTIVDEHLLSAFTAALDEKDRLKARAVKAEADDWRSRYEPVEATADSMLARYTEHGTKND